MPERFNKFTVLFRAGEKCIPELATRAGDWPRSRPNGYGRLEEVCGENFWTRESYRWNITHDGTIVEDCMVSASEKEMDRWLPPLKNQYGDISP